MDLVNHVGQFAAYAPLPGMRGIRLLARHSSIGIGSEDVVLSRYRRVAGVAAFGAGYGRLERAGRWIIDKLGIGPSVRLRVRPKSSLGFAKPSEHQSNGRQAKERQRGAVEVLEILRQAPAPSEPGKAAFDDPSFR